MSRRTCLTTLVASLALAAPATSLAQSSSQAQYQGVAPETRIPVAGADNGTPGGPAGTTSSGAATTTGAATPSGTGTSGASGNGGPLSGAPAAGGAKSNPQIPAPSASSDTMP